MCFPVYDCFFCIKLDAASKIIGFIYAVLCAGLIVLYSVPLALAWDALPPSRARFYFAMAASMGTLAVASCMLIVGAFWKKPVFFLPWVVVASLTSLPLMVTCVVGMVTLPLRHANADSAADESCIISMYFVHAILLFYFSCVVNSRRKELLRRNDKADSALYTVIHNQYHTKV
ncbi:uncharacterized protein LOC135077790 [Ostrinia nubilalis]|uniref:uncharacterized protein LOC135077790 n=1 Tax=Ostrinia nubilalis TaxID=29057 RepID=UPI0030823145